jgi:hypothetical protein
MSGKSTPKDPNRNNITAPKHLGASELNRVAELEAMWGTSAARFTEIYKREVGKGFTPMFDRFLTVSQALNATA